jgi:hypothetical protein
MWCCLLVVERESARRLVADPPAGPGWPVTTQRPDPGWHGAAPRAVVGSLRYGPCWLAAQTASGLRMGQLSRVGRLGRARVDGDDRRPAPDRRRPAHRCGDQCHRVAARGICAQPRSWQPRRLAVPRDGSNPCGVDRRGGVVRTPRTGSGVRVVVAIVADRAQPCPYLVDRRALSGTAGCPDPGGASSRCWSPSN